jgi:3-deoxy-D-manno-octulosonic-acid transferase
MTLFDLVLIPGLALFLPTLLKKKRSGWRERFGHVEPLPPKSRKRILLHAVSVGEVNALRVLVPLLTPYCEVVVSVTTDTGTERAKALFGKSCTIVRYPLDASWMVTRFLEAVQPDVVGLCELELWPQFIRFCRDRNIPVCVINGRLSARSFRNYKLARPILARTFNSLAFAAVQDADYQRRFIYMGVDPARCHITRSMKWDAIALGDPAHLPASAEKLAAELGIDRSRPLVVAGSTGPGEEALLHEAVGEHAQLLCAPRRPERFNEAAQALPGCVRRSQKIARKSSRYLLDSIGELRDAYALADIVVVGRSFGDQYGSDPIEPIAQGKPALIGPAYGDFQSIVEEFKRAQGIVITRRETLKEDLSRLLGSPAGRQAIAERGLACIRRNQGAAARHAELLLTLTRADRA